MTMFASKWLGSPQVHATNEILEVVRRCDRHAHRKECVAEELTYFSSKFKRMTGLAPDEDHANRVLTRWMGVFG